jgi:polysaccharide deacetylase 2 family uncharacterized protein YibQ
LSALSITGCSKKQLTKSELRQVTSEIVAAAERVTARKSEITIRPEVQPLGGKTAANPIADDIFVTLSSPSQLPQLRQWLSSIAKRHNLEISESVSGGVSRFEFDYSGSRTHTIHVVTPLPTSSPSPEVHPARRGSGSAKSPVLVLIIDDLGYDRIAADAIFALPFPVTVSVIPHLPFSAEIAEEAFRRGDQVMLHLPMQPESDETKTEEIELRSGMSREQVEHTLEGMLETVPHARGVNNHEGSRATADPALMANLMQSLDTRGLYFIDSRTTAATVAYDTAEKFGVPAASRKIFLDDVPSRRAILAQLDAASSDARRDGFAIAIGHPHPETIRTLSEAVPKLESQGMRLVFASDVAR